MTLGGGYLLVHLGSELTADDAEFGRALDEYKRLRGRKFPANSEVLAVLKSLGYRKVAAREPLPRLRGPWGLG